MQSIRAYEIEGRQFTEKDARKYLDELYGALVTSFAHKIVGIDKYAAAVNFLDHNNTLEQMQAIVKAADARVEFEKLVNGLED